MTSMRFILFAILFVVQGSIIAQSVSFGNKATVYLIRHAEKGTGQDPLLTSEGNKRSGDLMRVLKHKGIKHIYVTEYRRTQSTGDSLRIQLGIDTIHYVADTSCVDLLKKLKSNNDLNRPILIIGHSNTVPIIIRKLGLRNYPADNIPDDEFDNLFTLSFKNGKASLKKSKYGARSGVL